MEGVYDHSYGRHSVVQLFSVGAYRALECLAEAQSSNMAPYFSKTEARGKLEGVPKELRGLESFDARMPKEVNPAHSSISVPDGVTD